MSKQKRDRYQIDLLNDYISVINGGAFEIKLCFNEMTENIPMVKKSAHFDSCAAGCIPRLSFQSDPLVDIRVTCNMIQIRSCSDSANALIELLKYVITEGDLQQPPQQQQQTNEVSRSSTPIERRRSHRPVRMISDETLNNEQLTTDDVSKRFRLAG